MTTALDKYADMESGRDSPVIIESHINGARSKKMNPNTPITHDEIAEDAIRCWETGACAIHAHNTSFDLLGQDAYAGYMKSWNQVLQKHPDITWYPTTCNNPRPLPEEHGLEHIPFLPFLYGSPHAAVASGTLLGMRGWHDRGHLIRAVMEGVVFNHRTHVDALRDAFEIDEGRLAGGATNSERWVQMFSDTLGIPVSLTDAEESGALGTAMCAAVGAGVHGSLEEAAAATVRVTERLEPDAEAHERLEEKYGHYRRVLDALEEAWEASPGEPA